MLKLSSITKNYANRQILTNITAHFKPHSINVLGGANGSGKSTLLKIIAKLVPPSSGELEFNPSYLAAKSSTGYVGHMTFIYNNLTALENLDFWQKCYHLGLSTNELEDLLAEFKLLAFADAYPRTFSRGMLQKLTLARVFMLKPALCLLDEPDTGLDQQAKEFLYQKLIHLKTQGACIIMISHALESVRTLADQVYYLTDGQLCQKN